MHRRILLILFAILLVWAETAFLIPAGLSAAESPNKAAGKLPSELDGYKVKDSFFPTVGKPAGVIQSTVGRVVVARERSREAYYGKPGDRLYEQDNIYTLKGSRCRFKLNGEDVVTMGQGTKIGVQSFSEDKGNRTKKTALRMESGKARFYAIKLLRYKGAAMTVESPTAVVGVRGTDFGMDLFEGIKEEDAFLLKGNIDTKKTGGTGGRGQSVKVFSFQGSVMVTSTETGRTATLSGGQGIIADVKGLGAAFITPPGVAQQFMSDTAAPASAGERTTGGATTGGSTTGSGTTGEGSTGGGSTTPTPPDNSSVVQNQTTNSASSGETTSGSSHQGFFAGMLTYNLSGDAFKNFSMNQTIQDFESTSISGGDPFSAGHTVTADGSSSYLDPTMKSLTVTGDQWSGSQQIQHSSIGSNAYMEWGSWTQPVAMQGGSYSYYYDNKGYYVHGKPTTSAERAGFTGSGSYSGNAYGTYWTSGTGIDMTGSFSCDVNFSATSGQISNFNVSVANVGAGKSASITGGSGSFSGTSSQFSISGGTADITGSSPNPAYRAYGSVYGSTGQAIGGTWAIQGTGPAAVGIFQGTKPQ